MPQKGIQVTNTPDVLTDDVADLAIGLLLSVARASPRGTVLCERAPGRKEACGSPKVSPEKNRDSGNGTDRAGHCQTCRGFSAPCKLSWSTEKPGLVYPYYSKLEELARIQTSWL